MILHNEVVPAVDQVEVNPSCQQVEAKTVMDDEGVQIESWAPFAEGRNRLFENEILVSIAAEHEKSDAQVVLRWLVQRDVVSIPKSVHKERIVENGSIWDFELSDADMAQVATLDTACSLSFSHQDPVMVRQLGTRKVDI